MGCMILENHIINAEKILAILLQLVEIQSAFLSTEGLYIKIVIAISQTSKQ